MAKINVAMKGVINTSQEIVIRITIPTGAVGSFSVPVDLEPAGADGSRSGGKLSADNQEPAAKETAVEETAVDEPAASSWKRFQVPQDLDNPGKPA
jgi:hypothetical protein